MLSSDLFRNAGQIFEYLAFVLKALFQDFDHNHSAFIFPFKKRSGNRKASVALCYKGRGSRLGSKDFIIDRVVKLDQLINAFLGFLGKLALRIHGHIRPYIWKDIKGIMRLSARMA